MSNKRYTDEFKIEAVKPVTERGHSEADVAQRLTDTALGDRILDSYGPLRLPEIMAQRCLRKAGRSTVRGKIAQQVRSVFENSEATLFRSFF